MIEYNMEPIMPVLLEPGYFVAQAAVVMIITMVTLIFPLALISRFKIINAIKGH
jgi:hypothetical protein